MKIKYESEEIIIDLTENHKREKEKLQPAIIVRKKNYIIPTDLNKSSNKTIKVLGKSVNTYYYTCNCSEYRINAKNYSRRDFRRICKHIFIAITVQESNVPDLMTKTFIEHKFWFKIINIIELEMGGKIFYAGYTKEFDTFIVYLPEKIPKYFTYNITLMCWMDNEEPFEKFEWNKSLLKFFKRLNLFYRKFIAKSKKII